MKKKYVDKSAVVAEIRHLQLCTMDEHMNYYSSKAKAEYDILNELLLYLDTLEWVENTAHNAEEQLKLIKEE